MPYYEPENVYKDVKTLNQIIDRQGLKLLLHVVAERIGNTVLKHDLQSSAIFVMQSHLDELKDSILERI